MEPHTHFHLIIHCWIFFHHCHPMEHLTEDPLGHRQKESLCSKWVGWVRNHSVHKWWVFDSFCTHPLFSSLLQESDEEMGHCSHSLHQSLVLSIARTTKVCACSFFCLLRLLLLVCAWEAPKSKKKKNNIQYHRVPMSDSGWRGVYRVRLKKKKNWRSKGPELKSEELWRRRSMNECKEKEEEEEGRVHHRRVRSGKRKL
jgi:hypothetical protein